MANPRIKIPQKKISEFCQQYQVRRMALFGSVLRDDFRPDSDIDVLVVFDPSARITFMTLGKMKRELSTLFQRSVDLVPQDGLKPSIREAVLSSAQEVYAV
ncbi:MAG: nucleotidyltransferase family protein [Anaerolineaceae bacterium]|nr:nucleotidyltransferase family protein [Anaerolineaceae bacterium]